MFGGQFHISLHFNDLDVNNDCNNTGSDHKVQQQRFKSTINQTLLIIVQQKLKKMPASLKTNCIQYIL